MIVLRIQIRVQVQHFANSDPDAAETNDLVDKPTNNWINQIAQHWP